VRFTTNQGDLRFDLDRSIAPCNVQNFVDLVGAGFFDGTTCHRLSTTAGLPIIQCGDPTGTGAGGPGFAVKDEFPRDYPPATGYADAVTYPRGVIAMAGSTAPNSAGSQFFVTYGDAAITPRFSVIGRASNETLAVIEKVAAGGNDDGLAPGDGRPNITLTIQTSRLG
jgi:peptidyl-prolyl cis-trans isomerase B (cyclophilin B)